MTPRSRPDAQDRAPATGPRTEGVSLAPRDGATAAQLPPDLANRLGIAIGQQSYKAYRDLLASDRFQRLANFGALPQRLLYASTGTKDPKLSDSLYVSALASPNTVNTMPEQTLNDYQRSAVDRAAAAVSFA